MLFSIVIVHVYTLIPVGTTLITTYQPQHIHVILISVLDPLHIAMLDIGAVMHVCTGEYHPSNIRNM